MEQSPEINTLSSLYKQLTDNEPKPVAGYVPGDAAQQKQAFLEGNVHNPDHHYDKLESINFEERYRIIDEIGEDILSSEEMNPKYLQVYQESITNNMSKTRLMELATLYKAAANDEEKKRIGEEFMTLNIEIHGAPDETTYRSLLQEKVQSIESAQLSGQAAILRDELFAMIDKKEAGESIERFRPSEETVAWMHEVVTTLYGSMLAHVPEKSTFNVDEVQTIFTQIINDEFGEAASDWKVDVEPAGSINVKSTEKRIVIPEGRKDMTLATVRGLVVHELGVHMLRSITGSEADLDPLQHGLTGYYDSEEGLGVVFEQALKGAFSESGVDHYISAGLGYFDNKDFRDTYEVKWRLSALAKAIKTGNVSAEEVAASQGAAYGGTLRSRRGTDDLPWFKDLAYYNGAVEVWRYLDENRGDDIKFMFILMGKTNLDNKNHNRIMYETKTKN